MTPGRLRRLGVIDTEGENIMHIIIPFVTATIKTMRRPNME